MKAVLSIIKYYPDTQRDDNFGVGLIIADDSNNFSKVKISNERIKRINKTFGIKKNELMELAVKEYSAQKFNFQNLKYLSAYENGIIRFSYPGIIVTDNLELKFDELYAKYISDNNENTSHAVLKAPVTKNTNSNIKFQQRLKNNSFLNERLDIGYSFKNTPLSGFLFNTQHIDFIGGNGKIFSGNILNLAQKDEQISASFSNSITIFEALKKHFIKKFEPEECKFLILKEQADDPDKADYMDKLFLWHKTVGYGISIKTSFEEFEKDILRSVESKNIIKFEDWFRTE